MTDRALPCPFCGMKPTTSVHRDRAIVECANVDCRLVVKTAHFTDTQEDGALKFAISAWNTRSVGAVGDVTDEMVEWACVGFYGNRWPACLRDCDADKDRDRMRAALAAARGGERGLDPAIGLLSDLARFLDDSKINTANYVENGYLHEDLANFRNRIAALLPAPPSDGGRS